LSGVSPASKVRGDIDVVKQGAVINLSLRMVLLKLSTESCCCQQYPLHSHHDSMHDKDGDVCPEVHPLRGFKSSAR
jgi:hypothetical protein